MKSVAEFGDRIVRASTRESAPHQFLRHGNDHRDESEARKAILSEVDRSSKRLGTDHIDLYQIHLFEKDTPLEETLDALNEAVRAGKVLYLGACNLHTWQLMKALGIQRANGWASFISIQNLYRLVGGRLVATSQGAAAMFMYDDDRGDRIVVLTRKMNCADKEGDDCAVERRPGWIYVGGQWRQL